MHNIKIGDKDVKFVRSRGEVVYPNYVKDGLVLWYDFSGMENSGVKRGVAEDLSGNGNAGVLENFAFDEGSGYVDNGLEFDGVDDYVVKPNSSQEFTYSEFTLSSTFKSNQERPPHVGTLIGKGSVNDSQFYMLGFFLQQYLCFSVNDRRVLISYISEGIDLKKVNNFVGVKRNETLELWLNGSLLSNIIIPESLDVSNNYSLTIGRASYTQVFLDGNIYNSKIYNRALTPKEIAHNYKIDKHRFNIQD